MSDPLASLPGYVLRRASSAALAGLNRRLAPYGLRHADVSLLLIVRDRPGITQSEAGRMLDIQRANMVPIVARLEAKGLLDRRRADGRSQGLYLSEDGEGQAAALRRDIDAYETALIARLPEALREHALPVLTALWQAADAEPEQG
ncbi:MarR family transcriptional regulator [Novosphingobium sp. FSY-8]|uniref:MarR family transcriptional regulator n=1 Tax=Novosphingobium ovatum TaxID=1908523 RepID=A0ABW9XDE5_9SPHN|nr:MarR family transcriptional regulator [Novosphingobium ovatum]NBC36525.1 MarR family transcriptional regulator [Novosphingobium ovatum]